MPPSGREQATRSPLFVTWHHLLSGDGAPAFEKRHFILWDKFLYSIEFRGSLPVMEEDKGFSKTPGKFGGGGIGIRGKMDELRYRWSRKCVLKVCASPPR